MNQIDYKPLTATELRQVHLQAEHMRAQFVLRLMRKLFKAPRSLFSAPTCARPLRPH